MYQKSDTVVHGGGAMAATSRDGKTPVDLRIEPLTIECPPHHTGSDLTTSVKTRTNDLNRTDNIPNSQHPGGWKLVAIIAAVSFAIFLIALDQTIVSTAIPRITDEFQSLTDVAWYGSSYLLTRAAVQPSIGRIYSQFDLKYTFLASIAVFEIGSLVCATAPSSHALIIGRAVAGLGVSGTFTGCTLIVVRSAPLRKRPLMFGIVGSMWTVASVAGPLLGGVFTDKLSWRWCFYINLPIGAFTIVAIGVLIPRRKPERSENLTLGQRIRKLDLTGAILTICATVSLILALQWGGSTYAWNDPKIIGLLVAAGCLYVLLIFTQIRLGENGTFPPKIMRNRDIVFACLFCCFFGAGYNSLIYYLAIYYQSVRGLTALHAGFAILPLTISTSLSALGAGALITATGYYTPFMMLCMALFASGSGALTTLTVSSPDWKGFGLQILTGLGVGIGFEAGITVVQTAVAPPSISVAISVVGFAMTMGGTIFLAITQAVFQQTILHVLKQRAPQIDAAAIVRSGATDIYKLLLSMNQQSLVEIVETAYADAASNAFLVVTACASAAFAATCGLKWKSVKRSE